MNEAERIGRQNLERQNSWQLVEHARLYSDQLQAKGEKKEPLTTLGSQQRREYCNFCISGTPPRGWKAEFKKTKFLAVSEACKAIF